MSSSATAASPSTATKLTTSSLSLAEFSAAAMFLSASSFVASVGKKEETHGGKTEGETTVLTTVVPPLADIMEHLLKKREVFILHRFPRREPASDHSMHIFDSHTFKPVSGGHKKSWQLPESLTCIFDSCYLPHGLGRNKPAVVIATSKKCDASDALGWGWTIFVLDENYNCIAPPPSFAASDAPKRATAITPHPSEPSVVVCAAESETCVMCLNIVTAEWYRFGSGTTLPGFLGIDAILTLPSCGLLVAGAYGEDRIGVCDFNNPTRYENVNFGRFRQSQNDMCSTGFAPLGDHYFVCMVDWGLGVYNAQTREQIDFFALDHKHQMSCGCGGIVKALQVPKDQQSATLGLFIVFHVDVLQVVRCDHELQWSVVKDGGPLLEALTGGDGMIEVQFVAVI